MTGVHGPRAARWTASLVATLVLLRTLGTGRLASPSLGSGTDFADWASDTEPATAAMAVLRLAAEASVWYLLALTALGLLAGMAGRPDRGIGRLAQALAVPGADRVVRAGLGLGMAAAAVVSGPAGAGDAREGAAAAGTASMVPRIGDDGGTAWMRPRVDGATTTTTPTTVPGDPTSTTTTTTTIIDQTVDVLPAGTIETVRQEAAPTWAVSADESFWTIAADVLHGELGRAPTDAEIDPYWRRLIEHNRDRLIDPANPDLIHPGQVFETPTP